MKKTIAEEKPVQTVNPWLEPMSESEQQQLQVIEEVNPESKDDDEWVKSPAPTGWLEYAGLAKAVAGFVIAFVALQCALMVAGAWSYHWTLGVGALGIIGVPSLWLLKKTWRARSNGQRVEQLARVRLQAERLLASEVEGDYQNYQSAAESVLPLSGTLFSGQKARLGDYANTKEKLQDLDRQLALRCDKPAVNEVIRATRRTALGVAASPFLALDLLMALAGNMSLIGRVARAYGLAPSPFLEARLLLQVYRQIAALGAIELGSEVAGQTLSHEVLTKLSGRVAQGFSAGLYTYRIGITAMALCRPLGFSAQTKPKAGRVLKDLFSRLEADELGG